MSEKRLRPPSIRLIELVIAVSVVVISVASLFVAVHQSSVMERSLAASVWPIMEYQTGNYDSQREVPRLTFEFTNSGLGPAQVQWGRFHYQGETYSSIFDLLLVCCMPVEGDIPARRAALDQMLLESRLPVITDALGGRVLAPGQTVIYADMRPPNDEMAAEVWRRLDAVRHDVSVSLCYCSVFDECWLAGFPEQTRERVRECRAPD